MKLFNKTELSFSLDAGSTSENYRFIVYDRNLKVIESKEGNSKLNMNLRLASGDYLISVQAETNSNLDYELALTPTTINNDADPDSLENFTGQVFKLDLGKKRLDKKKLTSNIDYIDDIDTYKLEISEEVNLIIRTRNKPSNKRVKKRGQKVNLVLYDEDFNVVDEDIGGFHIFQVNKVSPGTYFMQISSPDNKTGKYHFKIIIRD